MEIVVKAREMIDADSILKDALQAGSMTVLREKCDALKRVEFKM